MKNFSGNKRSDRKKDFGKKAGRDSDRHSMYRTTCDHCGKDCEVPFKPTSGKPVFCSSCFEKNHNKDQKKFGFERGDRRYNSGESRKRNYSEYEKGTDQLKKEIALLNKKLDKILEILSIEHYEEISQEDFEEEVDEMPKPEKKRRKRTSSKKSES